MFKKASLAIVVASFLVSTNLCAKKVENTLTDNNKTSYFKQGFEEGIKATRFQALNDGFRPKSVKMKNNFVLVFDTFNVPYAEALYMQYIAAKDGFDETYITEHSVIFGSFVREVDAKEAQKKLVQMFGINTRIESCVGKTFLTQPLLFSDFPNEMFNKNNVVNATNVEIEKQQTKPKSKSKKKYKPANPLPEKQIVVNNAAYSYFKSGSKDSSRNFFENEIKASTNYVLDKKVSTKEGETFYKVKDKNLYFRAEDVEIK